MTKVCCICGVEGLADPNNELKVSLGDKYLGNNALPIKDGRCCDWCNENLVTPLRIREIVAQQLNKHKEVKAQ